jgi:GMP synthase - Glutamine amidotransferase domain
MAEPYQLTLLVTGQVPGHLQTRHGGYPEMFARRFAQVASVSWEVVDLHEGNAFVPSTKKCGYVITGSASGTYDQDPWIKHAHEVIRQLAAADHAMLGVCFGHQLLASALGGISGPHEKGFAIGTFHSADGQGHLYVHQDQVTALPVGFEISYQTPHCPIAGMKSANGRVVGMQFHPEFTPSFVQELAKHRGLTLSRAAKEPDRDAEDELLRDWLRRI